MSFDSQSELAIIGALSAIGGALAAFFPTLWLTRIKEKELKHSVATQFYAEIKAMLKTEQHRGYIEDIRKILSAFDSNQIENYAYKVEVSEERFPIFKSNLQNLGVLEPKIQGKIVLLYQLLEAVIQDIKPGGLLNSNHVGRKPYQELLNIMIEIKDTAEEILAEIELIHSDVC